MSHEAGGRPLLIDLFCKAGGAGMGYHRAGFDVLGIDIEPQPNYPFRFEQADALEWLTEEAKLPREMRAAAYHASPPCQADTAMRTMWNAKRHLPLTMQTRDALILLNKPYAIEGVVGAELYSPAMLCGSMFGLGVDGAQLRRHRLFETSFAVPALRCRHPRGVRTVGLYGEGVRDARRKYDKTIPEFTVEQGRVAMGIEWMTLPELCQAIPPAYTEYLGKQLLAHLAQRAAA